VPDDDPRPANPYGASKLAGERAAMQAFGDAAATSLGIARTSWLFGPPGRDFPHKILDAAGRAAAAGEALQVVADEWGSPTSAADMAEAIVELLAENAHPGLHHLVNGGIASRAEWAAEVLRVARVDVPLQPVPAATWPRDSQPPRWAVLAPTPLPSGEPMRPWQQALADQAVLLRRTAAEALTASRLTAGSRY
jgi:dTDP-4-dehydrorhamnose reductase